MVMAPLAVQVGHFVPDLLRLKSTNHGDWVSRRGGERVESASQQPGRTAI